MDCYAWLIAVFIRKLFISRNLRAGNKRDQIWRVKAFSHKKEEAKLGYILYSLALSVAVMSLRSQMLNDIWWCNGLYRLRNAKLIR